MGFGTVGEQYFLQYLWQVGPPTQSDITVLIYLETSPILFSLRSTSLGWISLWQLCASLPPLSSPYLLRSSPSPPLWFFSLPYPLSFLYPSPLTSLSSAHEMAIASVFGPKTFPSLRVHSPSSIDTLLLLPSHPFSALTKTLFLLPSLASDIEFTVQVNLP